MDFQYICKNPKGFKEDEAYLMFNKTFSGVVILDFHGVVMDVNEARFQAAKALLRRHGFNDFSNTDIRSWVHEGFEKIVDEITKIIKFDVRIEYGNQIYNFESQYIHVNFTLKEAKAVVPRAAVGILSNMLRSRLELIQGSEFAYCVEGADFLLTSSDVAAKPNPGGIEKVLSEFCCDRAAAVMIGNSSVDCMAAEAAGVAYLHCHFDPEVPCLDRDDLVGFSGPQELLSELEVRFGHL